MTNDFFLYFFYHPDIQYICKNNVFSIEFIFPFLYKQIMHVVRLLYI